MVIFYAKWHEYTIDVGGRDGGVIMNSINSFVLQQFYKLRFVADTVRSRTGTLTKRQAAKSMIPEDKVSDTWAIIEEMGCFRQIWCFVNNS